METQTFPVFVRGLRLESPAVTSFELAGVDGVRLPAFTPGAHVDVCMPGGLIRSYSLVRRTADGCAYEIAVKREPESRGGSAWLHAAPLGARLVISRPKGAFELVEEAAASVFIAGGIGITPLLPMLERLVQLGRSCRLHYAAASPAEMAFRDRLRKLADRGGVVIEHFSDGSSDRLDVDAVVGSAAREAHLYCCGPARMIDAFIGACEGRAAATVHYERFAAGQEPARQGGYTVELARDGRSLDVPPGKTILDVLLESGLDVPYSCGQGVCGSCQTRVLAGQPDHRDCFLTEEERAANDTIVLCCSGARSAHLVLDL